VARPFKSLGPGLVSEPVADEIGITSINENRYLLKDARDKAVVRFHPVTMEEEVAVDVKIAGVVTIDLGTDSRTDFRPVQIFGDVAHTFVTKVTLVLALAPNVVHVLSGALIRSEEGVVTVDGGGDTDPSTLAVVARLNHRLASTKSIVHGAAAALIQHSRIATLTTGHGAVVFVLGETVGQAVAD
jgi:hypothetical protein